MNSRLADAAIWGEGLRDFIRDLFKGQPVEPRFHKGPQFRISGQLFGRPGL